MAGDAERIFLLGHSAGAHLAATLAYDGRYLDAVGVDRRALRGFVGLSGPYAIDPSLRTIYTNVFPMPPNREAEWLPVQSGGQPMPAALLIQGDDDWMVSQARAPEFAARLQAQGISAAVQIYDGASHQDTVAGVSGVWRVGAPVFSDVRRFLEERSGNPAQP